MAYQGPSWAEVPSETWTLVEIKGGVQIARHNLSSRPFTLLGRDADQAHIALPHESCSRLHARIAFEKATGTPWLRDLQSTHGTIVNKKNVPPASCGKTESTSTKPGSRGVVIYPSDILQFGASTRLYCVEGPESFARNKLVPLPKKKGGSPVPETPPRRQDVTADKHEETLVDNQDNHQISWGIDMDDHALHDDGTEVMRLPANLSEQDIPDRLRKEWTALRARQYKLEHTQEESERIRRKGDLTNGQERQLGINQERIDSLRQDIESKEASLYRKLFPEKVNQAKRREAEKSTFFDDDQVEDRTKDRKRSIFATDETESEESLLKKRKTLVSNWKHVNSALKSHSIKCDELKDRIRSMQARGDDETFFVQNDLDMATDALKKEKTKLREIDYQLEEVDKLLKVINPKLFLEKPTDDPEPPANDGEFAMPAPVAPPRLAPSSDNDAFPLPRPVQPPPSIKDAAPILPQPSKDAAPSPPTKRRKVHGAAMPPPGFSAPPQSTAATISSLLNQSPPNERNPVPPPSASRKAETKKAPVVAGDEKHDKWKPPEDQDGSGYTRLNAKFAGRY